MVRLSVIRWISSNCCCLQWICSFRVSTIDCHKAKPKPSDQPYQQLGEIIIITSLPLVISYHAGFGIWIGIIFVCLSVFNVIHSPPMMYTLITWIQHELCRFWVARIFLDNTVGVKTYIFWFAYVIQPLAQQWSAFANLSQACVLEYLVIINVLFTKFDELVEKA